MKKRIFLLCSLAVLLFAANSVKASDENAPGASGAIVISNPSKPVNDPNFEMPAEPGRIWVDQVLSIDPNTNTPTTAVESINDPTKSDYNPNEFYQPNAIEKPVVAEGTTNITINSIVGPSSSPIATVPFAAPIYDSPTKQGEKIAVSGDDAASAEQKSENIEKKNNQNNKNELNNIAPENSKVAQSISVETAKAIVSNNFVKAKIKKIDLAIVEQKPVYKIQAEQQVKIFGLIPVSMQITAQLNSQNGTIEKIEKPWWSFLVSG